MKNLKKYIAGIGVFAFALGLMFMGGSAHAAADATLTGAIASSSSFFSENLTVIINFVIENVFKLAGAGLAILAIYWIIRKIRSLFKR